MKPPVARFRAPLIDWGDLKIVLAVSRALSLKKAAQHLGMTESTVSRHVGTVEEHLGVVLFERTPTGMRPTPACDGLAEHLARAESEVEAGIEASSHLESMAAGRVRLTSVPTIINHIIIPAARSFTERFDGIELEIVAAAANLSMTRREADLAVRLARPSTDLGAVTRRIGKLHYGVYVGSGCHPDLPWITYEKDMAELPQVRWIARRREQFGESICSVQCSDTDGLIAALRAGMGKALLPREIYPSVAGLDEVHGYDDLPIRELWLLAHPNLVMTRRVRIVIDWLVELFAGLNEKDGAN